MAVLTMLDPTPMVPIDGYDFIALAAGPGDGGLEVSLSVSNGDVGWADNVIVCLEARRLEAAAGIARATKLTSARANHGLLQLLPKAEKSFRERRAAGGGNEEWPDPIPLSGAKLPPFPVACFPDWLRAMVTGTAEQLQVPVDLPALLALAVLGTALAGKVEVMVRSRYYVPLNCYVMVGMESGERKSPTYRAMLRPLVEHEHDLIASVKEQNDQRALSKETPLPWPQLFADDITTEQVPVILEQNEERLAIFSDEGDSLDIMAGRYSKGTPNFGIYLRAWDGGAYKVNRGMRPSIYLRHPLLSIGLCVQPSVLQGLAETPAFRDRGLLGRFWFALPTSYMGWRKPFGAPPPDQVVENYSRAIRALLALPLGERPAVVALSHEAHEALVGFSRDMEPRLRPDGDVRTIKDWVAKLEGSIARLAGQLHMAWSLRSDIPLGAGTMERAIILGRYLLEQAQGTFGLMRADPHRAQAEILLRWIQRRGLTEFSRRDVYKGNPTHFEHPDDCLPALALLIDRFYIAQRGAPSRAGGRPPTPVYDVNPKIIGQNTQNPTPPEEKEEEEGYPKGGQNTDKTTDAHSQYPDPWEGEMPEEPYEGDF